MKKIILVDLSQVLLASILVNSDLDRDLILHICVNSIRGLSKKFKPYDEFVLCCDSRNYWRKGVFPHYKSGRKESREKSTVDWNMIFECINTLKSDVTEYFPYKLIDVDGAEADDVIATLTEYNQSSQIIICSSDGDYKQLHKYKNVKQYNPMLEVYIKSSNPQRELKEKIIRGDKGDGIPSILSQDDVFVIKKRQSPISSKKLETWLDEDDLRSVFTEDMYRNYKRNDLLINFENIPVELKERIITEYNEYKPKGKGKLFDYLMEKKMVNLISNIEDF